MQMLLQVGGLMAVILFTLGPVLGLMLLLNRRDKRQAALLERAWQLTPREISDRIAIQVCCPLLPRWRLVTVEMQDCARDEIWEAVARWSANLPPRVRLQVIGRMDCPPSARFTLETTCGRLLRGFPRSATVAG
jgi:hypothetical protein